MPSLTLSTLRSSTLSALQSLRTIIDTATSRFKMVKVTGKLVLVRHGQSEWNHLNLFTGWKDPELSEKGILEAKKAAELITKLNIKFDVCFTSLLKRAKDTANIILKDIHQEDMQVIENLALNERDYGDLAGLNKDDARKKFGEEQVHIWRRSYDIPPPNGESLKGTADRVLPYFDKEIAERLRQGENILVAAHGNSLRSLIMKLDNLSREEIVNVEVATGVPIVYILDEKLNVISKEILQ